MSECYSISLFWSFNEDNEKSIFLFESLSERKLNGWGGLIPLYSLKISIFHSLQNCEELEVWGRRPKYIDWVLGLGPCPKRHNGPRIDQ